MRTSAILALSAFLGLPMAAAAQDVTQQRDAGCLCFLPVDAGPRIAAVEDVQGQVLLSGALGYTPIESNAGLSAGDTVVLLDDGRAVLTGPACRVALAPDSVISLNATEAGICVAHAVLAPTPTQGEVEDGIRLTGTQIPGLIVAGGLVVVGVAGGVIQSLSEGDRPSPVSP